MARISAEAAGGQNVCAFLDTLAESEIGAELLAASDDGYNVVVGSTPENPILFADYSVHPRMFEQAEDSDAAGRYQFMGRYWPAYKVQIPLPDFGPLSQDLWAIQLIRECHAVGLIQAGNLAAAIAACRSRWASLPGSPYGQHEQSYNVLKDAFLAAGGALAPSSA